MEEKQKVCVIGAGLAGLTSVKCMLDARFTVKCFEKEDHIGGRWHPNNKNAIPRSTVTNVPQYMSCYSDFPMFQCKISIIHVCRSIFGIFL